MTEIILFGYPTSPYYGKVILVLNFLKLPYKICPQPRMLPRPDFASVGINYRRIPLLSIDGHVYCDTNLIINKLCALAGVENFRETEAMGNALFGYGAMLIPYDLIADPAFLKDRAALTGRPWEEKTIKAGRPFALSQFKANLEIIAQLLQNGGGFVRDGRVTMADLHLAFVVQWVLVGHKGAGPEVSPATYPTIYAWLKQIHTVVATQKAEKISFDLARKQITRGKSHGDGRHDAQDGLKVGQQVSVTPTDTGRTHPQVGELQYLNASEVCLKTSGNVILSCPRLNYIVMPVKAQKL